MRGGERASLLERDDGDVDRSASSTRGRRVDDASTSQGRPQDYAEVVDDEDGAWMLHRSGTRRRRRRGVMASFTPRERVMLAFAGVLAGFGACCLGLGSRATATGAAPTRRLGSWTYGFALWNVSAPGSMLDFPVYVIGDKDEGVDFSRAQRTRLWIRRLYKWHRGQSEEALDGVVLKQSSVFPDRWPKDFDQAVAIANRFTDLDITDGSEITRKLASAVREVHRTYVTEAKSLSALDNPILPHHLGCMLSHMSVINRGLESGAPYFVGLESDSPDLQSVSPLDYPVIAANLPEDADMVWMVRHGDATGQFVARIHSTAWGTHPLLSDQADSYRNATHLYLYEFNRICGWAGLASYMLTRRGAEKIRDFIVKFDDLDMIDAWLSGQCVHVCHKQRKRCMNLKCYNVQSLPVDAQKLGGFVPEWYPLGDVQESRVKRVDVDYLAKHRYDVQEYNRQGCARKHFKPWIPHGYDDDLESADRDVSGCTSAEAAAAAGVDPCSPDSELPWHIEPVRIARAARAAQASTAAGISAKDASQ